MYCFVSDGDIQYTKTHDEAGPYAFDDDSNTSDGAPSPLNQVSIASSLDSSFDTQLSQSSSASSISFASIPSPPDITPLLQKMQTAALQGQKLVFTQNLPQVTSQSLQLANSSISFTSSSLSSSLSKNGNISISSNGNNSGKVSRIKKKTQKSAPKSKVIKFHEYKGPPSSQKTQQIQPLQTPQPVPPIPAPTPDDDNETPYNVLLQQQQLFLQWQLEFQQKNLPFILPAQKGAEGGSPQPAAAAGAPPSATSSFSATFSESSLSPPLVFTAPSPSPSPAPAVPKPPPPPPPPPPQPKHHHISKPDGPKPAKFEDMKVADLKAELKKLNLPVSGAKPQLIEKLKPYAHLILNQETNNISTSSVSRAQSCSIASSIPSVSSLSSVGSPQPVSSAESSPAPSSVASVQNLQSLSGLINIQPITPHSVAPSDDLSMTLGSPPQSPASSSVDLNISHGSVVSGPLSPDMNYNMDMVASPPMISLSQQQVTKNQLSSSVSTVPMVVDQQHHHQQQQQMSRPPSVAPMDIDLGSSQPNLAAAVYIPQMPIMSPPQHQPVDSNQNANPTPPPQPAQAQAAQLQPQFISVQVPPQAQVQVGQPQVISQDELVRQQQRQIEELRRQLQQSQLQLRLHAATQDGRPTFTTVQQPQQSQNLQSFTLAQPSATSLTSGTALTSIVDTNAGLAQTVTHATVPQVAQIQIQPVQPQPHTVRSITLTRTSDSISSNTDTKPSMNALQNILQNHTVQQSLSALKKPKVVISSAAPSSQSYIFTSAPGSMPQISAAQLAHIATTSSSSAIKSRVITVPPNGLNVTAR